MNLQSGIGFDYSSAPLVTTARSRSISPENPNGDKGQGGQATNHLGIGRKGRPCIAIKGGETVTIANIQGPGVLQHFWVTVTDKLHHRAQEGNYLLRDVVLRMYWDDEVTPSVEVPLGDFFCNGFGIRTNVNSLPISVNPTGGMNCYFAMPFHKSAKITIENQHSEEISGFFYTFNYTLVDSLTCECSAFPCTMAADAANRTRAGLHDTGWCERSRTVHWHLSSLGCTGAELVGGRRDQILPRW
jgi:hypothetical protein